MSRLGRFFVWFNYTWLVLMLVGSIVEGIDALRTHQSAGLDIFLGSFAVLALGLYTFAVRYGIKHHESIDF